MSRHALTIIQRGTTS